MPTVYRVNDAEGKTRFVAVADSAGQFLLVQPPAGDISDEDAIALLTQLDVVSDLLFAVSGHPWPYFEEWLRGGEDIPNIGEVTLVEIGQVAYAAG